MYGNPFRADRFGHARSVTLYRRWFARQMTITELERLGFNGHEINALVRWRQQLDRALLHLAGRDLQCWRPLNSRWCHVDTLLHAANRALPVREVPY